MEFRALRRDGKERFLLGRAECVADNHRAIGVAKQRYVTGGMSGSVHPAPAGKGRNGSVYRKFANACSEVDWSSRIQRCHARHDAAADRWVRTGIRALACYVRKFLAMRVHRHPPGFKQVIDCADVIEMCVREDDRLRRGFPEVLS